MNAELQEKLFSKYPKLFAQKNLPMTQTCMCWGCECDSGWYHLIDSVCSSIQSYVDNHNYWVSELAKSDTVDPSLDDPETPQEEFPAAEKLSQNNKLLLQPEFTQVKEKLGGLTIYIQDSNDHVNSILRFAQELSYKICECCGKMGDGVGHTKGWIKTICKDCLKNDENKHINPDNWVESKS